MKRSFLLILAVFVCVQAVAFAEDALTVIKNRKSVRTFSGAAVPKAELETMLRAGMAAPTAMDKRPWAFVVVTQKVQLEALAKGLPYSQMLHTAGAAIVVCGVMEKALPGDAQAFWVQDCSAATENILLAVEAQGLGAVWTGVYPAKDKVDFVRACLGLPDGVIPLNVIPIGYPAGNEKPKDKYDEKNIHWEKW